MSNDDGVQIYDDVVAWPPSPETLARIKAWFDEMVAEGRIEVLTWRIKDGSVTIITKGETPLGEREPQCLPEF